MWKRGRQETGYFKLKLLQLKNFDCYLLKFPQGSEIPEHIDPVMFKRHYRLNIVLKKARVGGKFLAHSGKKPIINWPRVILFRPDVTSHGVSKIEKGTRYVLSFGWALK